MIILINDNFEVTQPLKTPIYFKIEIEQKMSLWTKYGQN